MSGLSRVSRRSLPVLMLFSLAACAGGTAMMAPNQPAPIAVPDQARIIFLRPEAPGATAVSASVFDVSGAESKFIGFVNTGQKVGYSVAPGDYSFMVVSEAADFLKATVVAGRTYYVLVTPRIGMWRARFSLRPVRHGELAGSEFASWDSGTEFAATTPAAEEWARRNAQSIKTKRDRYWPEWTGKPAEQRASQTLDAADGR